MLHYPQPPVKSQTVTCLQFKSIDSQAEHFGSIGLMPIQSMPATGRPQAIVEHARRNTPPERKTPRLEIQAGCCIYEAICSLQGLLGDLDDGGESRGVVDGHIGEHLAVQLHASLLQAVH